MFGLGRVDFFIFVVSMVLNLLTVQWTLRGIWPKDSDRTEDLRKSNSHHEVVRYPRYVYILISCSFLCLRNQSEWRMVKYYDSCLPRMILVKVIYLYKLGPAFHFCLILALTQQRFILAKRAFVTKCKTP